MEADSVALTSAMPCFAVRDLEKAIGYYVESLGFKVSFRNGNVFAIVTRNQVEIGLSLDRSGDQAGRGGCYVKLQGVDSLHEELGSRGIHMVHELKTEAYGMREFMIRDLDGNTLNFGEPVKA